MSDYADTKQAVRAAVMAGGFSASQADAVVAALGAPLQASGTPDGSPIWTAEIGALIDGRS